MTPQHHADDEARSSNHISTQDTGTLSGNVHDDIARNKGDAGTFEETPTLQQDPAAMAPVGASGGAAGMIAAATTLTGANDVKAINQSLAQGARHEDSQERGVNDTPSMMEKATMPRATWERIEGETQEVNDNRDKALQVDKAGYTRQRAENCRQDAHEQVAIDHDTNEEAKEKAQTPVWEKIGESRSNVMDVAKTISMGLPKEVADQYTDEQLAEMLANVQFQEGGFLSDNGQALLSQLKGQHGVPQDIEDIDIFGQEQATIENVRVKALFDPRADSQQQVGYITDGMDAKLTVWVKSGKKTILRKNDIITLRGVAVSAHNTGSKWVPNLAVTSDTEIVVEETNPEGDAPRNYNYPSTDDKLSKIRTPNTMESIKGQRAINRKIKRQAPERTTHPAFAEAPETDDDGGIYSDLAEAVDEGRCIIKSCDCNTHEESEQAAFDSIGELIEHIGNKAEECDLHESVNRVLLFGTWDRSAEACRVFGGKMKTPTCPCEGCDKEVNSLQQLISHAGGMVNAGRTNHKDITDKLDQE